MRRILIGPWQSIFLLTGLYYGIGKLSLLLAIPPGFAAPIWPPAGIALAAILVWGRMIWPGIFFGSLLVNVGVIQWHNFDLTLFSNSAVIAAAASLQALFGAELIKRFFGREPLTLETGRQIFGVLGFGVLSCLINPAIGSTSLRAFQLIDPAQHLFTFLNWWIGDSIGVFILTPLCIVSSQSSAYFSNKRKLQVGLPVLGLMILAISVFGFTRSLEKRATYNDFVYKATSLERAIRDKLNNIIIRVDSVQAFYDASDFVSAEEFQKFVAVYLQHPDQTIQAFEWAPKVLATERKQYEALAQARYPGFQFLERASVAGHGLIPVTPRLIYYPIYYLEPYEGNASVLGYDLASTPNREAFLSAVIESGRTTLSEPVLLYQNNKTGLLLFRAVYDQIRLKQNPANRLAAFKGFVLGVVDVEKLIEAVFRMSGLYDINLQIQDQTIFYGQPLKQSYFQMQKTLSIGERQWILDFSILTERVEIPWYVWEMLIISMLLTGLFSAFLLLLTARSDIFENLVNQRTQELQKANRAKSEFLSMMSHEIRTPLTAILGYTDILSEKIKQASAASENARLIKKLSTNSQHLLLLINDILDFSKIEANQLILEKNPFEVDVLLSEIQELFEGQFKIKSIQFSISKTDQVPSILVGDSLRIKQILINLIGNSIKFTDPGGSVVLSLDYRSLEQQFICAVSDTGIGIPIDQQSKLFIPFYQTDSSNSRRYGGTGLGLSISKQLCLLMSGDLTCSSQVSQGTTFTAVLEVPNLEANPLESVESEFEPAEKEHRSLQGTILVAEDLIDNQELITWYLKPFEKLEVDFVQEGKEVLRRVQDRKTPYDLILMDIQMPGLDGLEVMKLLRQKGYIGPIIAMTANILEQEIQSYLQAGFNTILGKPFIRARFNQLLTRYLRPGSEGQPSKTDITDTKVNLENSESLSELEALKKRWLMDLPAKNTQLIQAVELRDIPKIRNILHQLKGGLLTFKYTEYGQRADQLEKLLREGDPLKSGFDFQVVLDFAQQLTQIR